MKYIRLAALAAPAVGEALSATSPQDKFQRAIMHYTGYYPGDGSFEFSRLAKGWGPYAAAVAVTYGIPKLAGIIRGL